MFRYISQKKNPGQCYCSSCTPKRISSCFWFGCLNGDKNVYAACYAFIDRKVKKLLYEIPASVVQCENIDYTKGLSCITFYIGKESLLSLNGFCQNFKPFFSYYTSF